MTTEARTAATPEGPEVTNVQLGRSSVGYIVSAEGHRFPFPRLGDVIREGRTWLAMPMYSFERVECASRTQAVRFVCEVARDGNSVEAPEVGTTVRALYPNTRWGTGEVVEVLDNPKLKPYRVRRADGTVGSFTREQIATVATVEQREAYFERHIDAMISRSVEASA